MKLPQKASFGTETCEIGPKVAIWGIRRTGFPPEDSPLSFTEFKKNWKIACKNQNFACLGFKIGIGFLKKFLDRSVSFLRQETHEHVKTIKKRCLEAKNHIFRKNEFK